MINSRGSTLALALSAMFLVSALGIGAINYATMQGQSSSIQTSSAKAFWLADAGMVEALNLVTSFNGTTAYPQCVNDVTCAHNVSDSNFPYKVNITLPPGQPWLVTSTASVGSGLSTVQRTLYAQVGYAGLTNSMSTTGTVVNHGHPTETPAPVQNQPPVSFSSVFGITLAQAQAIAAGNNTYYDCTASSHPCGSGSSLSIPGFSGNQLVYVNLSSSQTVSLSGGWSGNGLFIVNGGTLDMSGGGSTSVNFTGVIWIENGSFSSISGGIGILGSVYINGSPSTVTTFNGTSVDLTYDANAVQSVMSAYGTTQRPRTICWSEISCN